MRVRISLRFSQNRIIKYSKSNSIIVFWISLLCSALRDRIDEHFDDLNRDYDIIIEINRSVYFWARFASVDERMNWMLTFIYCWTRKSRVDNKIKLNFKTIISICMSGRKKNKMNYNKNWKTFKRKSTTQTEKIQNT